MIIGVLVLAFSTSFVIRSQPANYGFELNEFDPFFNFRATEYIIENGFLEYFSWWDDKSWYPQGRDVSATSQIMLHITAATTYQIFASNYSVYDFTVMFPVIIGSLTVIVIFGLVRLFAGTTAGLIASLFFAISLPIILRGSLGWFKSEPLGLFYGLLGLYLFLSGIRSKNKKIVISKIIFGGIIMGFGISSWGGNQFFIIPIGLFILALPFVRKDHKFLLWSIPLFIISLILTASLFEARPTTIAFGLPGLALIIPTLFLISCIFIQKISRDKNKVRNGLILLIFTIIFGSFLVIVGDELNILPVPSFRYLNAINPFLTTLDPLTDSVAEHATTTIDESYYFHSVLLIFGGIGVWLILTKKILQNEVFIKNDMAVFVLILGMVGVYISSAFVRLEVFASIALIILASIGLSILTKEIFKIQYTGIKNYIFKTSFVIIVLILFVIPLTYPVDANWISLADFPQTIVNGGSMHPASTDWLETLEWIKMNTPENAVIASWWDYGYWISTMSERTTLVDNATLSTGQIKKVAEIFVSTPDKSWNMLNEWDTDYVVLFVAVQKLDATTDDGRSFYVLNGGGDESKKPWIIRIAEVPLEKYLRSDDITGTDYFWNETLLGKMIPFTTVLYYNDYTQQTSENFIPGFIPISVKDIKYNLNDNTPLNLVYASSSFINEQTETETAVLVYQVNKNYTPSELDLK